METFVLRKEAIDIINKLPENKIQKVIQFAQFILKYDDSKFGVKLNNDKHAALLSLSGSVKDDSFVRPAQPLLADDAARKTL